VRRILKAAVEDDMPPPLARLLPETLLECRFLTPPV
jgi:hypothetical protein